MEVPLEDGDAWPERPDARPPHARRCPARTAAAAERRRSATTTATPRRTGGTARSSTARARRSRSQLRTFTGRQAQDRRRRPPAAATRTSRASTSPASTRTGGSGSRCLHTLFTKEHNAICDVLKKENPRLGRPAAVRHRVADQLRADGEDPHGRVDARASSTRPALWLAMNVELVRRLRPARQGPLRPPRRLRDLQRDHGLAAGAPRRALPADRGVRLRLPDAPADPRRLELLRPRDGRASRASAQFDRAPGPRHPRRSWTSYEMADLIYSMGVEHPGAITLHNYPRALQRHERIDGELMDLATLDILRDRERGVPRYNDFREEMRMPRVRSFEELTRQQAVGRGDPPRLRQRHRQGRPAGRHVRRAAAAGLRLLRHRVPRVHPDGVAPAEERPLLHHRLHARGLHPDRHRLGEQDEDEGRASCATTPSSSRRCEGLPNAFLPWNKVDADGGDGKVASTAVEGMKKALAAHQRVSVELGCRRRRSAESLRGRRRRAAARARARAVLAAPRRDEAADRDRHRRAARSRRCARLRAQARRRGRPAARRADRRRSGARTRSARCSTARPTSTRPTPARRPRAWRTSSPTR